MAIVLRFVDDKGILKERFFGIVSVDNTASSTLRDAISHILAQYNLRIDDLRGQGYDGASNMRGAFNGLQALFKDECPYAYYVHCFAHQLQLSLVAASKEVSDIWLFFSKLNNIVNIITASPKRQSELTEAQKRQFAKKVGGGRGSNQVQTLQRAGATRWSSHFNYVSSLIDLFGPCVDILVNLSENSGATPAQRAEAKGAYKMMQKFDFVFLLHLLREMMETTHLLCQALQRKDQDIVNAMSLVSSTKQLLQRLRDDEWQTFFDVVVLFCNEEKIDVPEMDAPYKSGTGRSCQQCDIITKNHHYRVDIFNAAIDFQLMELNHRFSETTMELLILGSALDPRDSFKSFNVDKICELAEKFYPVDFQDEPRLLRKHLLHFEIDVVKNPKFQNLSTLSELCVMLAETGRGNHYVLVDRLVRLLLTLPVSTATTERAFSAMKLVKTRLRSKMDDDFLEDCMILAIERDLSDDMDLDSIVDEFDSLKERRVQFR